VAVTTLELLDALEKSIARNRADRSTTAASAAVAVVVPAAVAPSFVHPEALRARIEKAGVSTEEFAAIFGVNPMALRGWLEVGGQVPAWVQPALQMLEALGPAARRRIFHLAASAPPEPKPRAVQTAIQTKSHPFSRIEDL
jgi:DNA-binding transcriptional regulator YiaG